MCSLAFLAGILAGLHLPSGWQGIAGWACLGLLPVLALRPGWWRLLFAVAGFWHATLATSPFDMPWPVAGERVLAQARIASVPALDEDGWQFDARVRLPRHPDWPERAVRLRRSGIADAPAVGELWQFVVRVDAPRDGAVRRRLLRDHLAATGSIADSPLNQRLAAGSGGLDALRTRLARRIGDRVADPSAAALLAALAVGVTGEVSTRQWAIFNATGITHLVAISGMHVTFFAMLSMAAGRRIWPRIAHWRAVPRRELFAAATGVLMALLYALLSGFSVPAQRTVAMLAAFLMARESARRTAPSWSIAAAMWAVLLLDPMASLSAGFWLSFIAVAAIVLLHGARVLPDAPLPGAVQLQWLVTIALLPVTVAIFGSFSAIGMLANALAIPVFTFLLVPPVLVATALHLLPAGIGAWPADRLVDLAAWAAAAMWPAIATCAGLPHALWRTVAPWSWFVLAPLLTVLALLPVPRRLRLLAMAALCATFLQREPRPASGQLWIDLLDTGSSPALVLRTRRHLAIWGTGEAFGSAGGRFERQVMPVLRAAGYPAIDLWLPGNLTRDAQAALRMGRAQWPATIVLPPDPRGLPPESRQCALRTWTWDGLEFELSQVDGGCRLVVTRGEVSMAMGAGVAADAQASGPDLLLLPRAASATQAIEAGQEQMLLAGLSATDWNSPAWLRQRERMRAAGATVLATAGQGRVRLQLDARGIRRRYLHQAGGLHFDQALFGYHPHPCWKSCELAGPSCGPSSCVR